MANRSFNRLQALQKEVKHIHAKVTIGATGAPTLVTASSLGVASISRTSAGLYVLTLQDKYMDLVNARISMVCAAVSNKTVNVKSEAVDSAKTVTFQVSGPTSSSDTTPVAVDPANGDSLLITLELKNSSVVR